MASSKGWSRLRLGALAIIILLLAGFAYLVSKAAVLSESALRADIASRLAEWSGGRVEIDGPVRLRYFPQLAVTTGPFLIRSAPAIPRLNGISAASIEVDLGLMSLVSRRARLRRIAFTDLNVALDAPQMPAGAAADPEALNAMLTALRSIPAPEVAVINGTIKASGPKTDETFSAVNAFASMSGGGMLKASGGMTWRGQPVNFDLATTLPAPENANARSPVTLALRGPLLSADVDGELTVDDGLRATGNLDLQIEKLRPFARWLGLLIPDGPGLDKFVASGGFTWAGHRLGFDEGNFTLDGNRALGTMTLDFGGIRPLISGTLAFSTLDLTPYGFKSAEAATPGGEPGTSAPHPIATSFPLLHHLDLDLRLSSSTVATPRMTLGQVAMSATVRAGRLTADFAVLDLCDGVGNGRVDLDATAPESEIRLTGNFSGIAAHKCLQLALGHAPLSASLELLVDLSSRGRTAGKVLSQLGGKVSLKSGAGTLALDMAALKPLSSPVTLNGWAPLTGGSTAFSSLSGDLIFRQGNIFADRVRLRADPMLYTCDGTVDMAHKTFDLSMLTRNAVAKTKDGKPSKDAEPETEATVTGSWLQPVISLRKAGEPAQGALSGSGGAEQQPSPVR